MPQVFYPEMLFPFIISKQIGEPKIVVALARDQREAWLQVSNENPNYIVKPLDKIPLNIAHSLVAKFRLREQYDKKYDATPKSNLILPFK